MQSRYIGLLDNPSLNFNPQIPDLPPMVPPTNQTAVLPPIVPINPPVQPKPAQSNSIFTDPKSIALLVGLTLAQKMNNKNASLLDVLPTVQTIYNQSRQQAAITQLKEDIKNSPALKDPATRALVSDLVATGEPSLISKAYDMIKTPVAQPYTLSPGQVRYDANGNVVASVPITTTETQIQKNLEAAGYKPGTPEYKEALENYLVGGGRSGGVGKQAISLFKSQLKFEHPDWDNKKLDKAASAYFEGKNVLEDGSVLPSLSGTAQQYRDQAMKAGTTAALITRGVQANAGEAELQVLNNLAMEDAKPYARSVFGKSPQQIIDTFKSDDDSQSRLGKFIASQAAQYEIAQIRNRIYAIRS